LSKDLSFSEYPFMRVIFASFALSQAGYAENERFLHVGRNDGKVIP
jgi:hypothetical protein